MSFARFCTNWEYNGVDGYAEIFKGILEKDPEFNPVDFMTSQGFNHSKTNCLKNIPNYGLNNYN